MNIADLVLFPTCAGPFFKDCLLIHFRSRTPKPSFPAPGSVPRPRECHSGLFESTRINVDQVSAQTVDSGPISCHLCKLCLLGWGTTCFELRVPSGIAFRTPIIGPTCAGPSFERLSFKRLSLEKCQKAVFRKKVPRRLDYFNVTDLTYFPHILRWRGCGRLGPSPPPRICQKYKNFGNIIRNPQWSYQWYTVTIHFENYWHVWNVTGI